MKYQAPALTRGLEILEILSSNQEPLTLNKIADELNLTTNQVFRLIYVLTNSGYIKKVSSDKYIIGSKLFSFGMKFITNYSFLDIVLPILKEISFKTKQSCHCSIKVDGKMVVIAKADSPNSFLFSIRVGYSKDLENSASGKVILAYLNKDELALVMNKIEEKHTKDFLDNLNDDIQLIKKQVYTISASPYVKGIKDIAVPVIAKMSHIGVFSLVIPYVSIIDNQCTEKQSLKVLQEGASKISQLLV